MAASKSQKELAEIKRLVKKGLAAATSVDFSKAINRLKLRAKAARRTSKINRNLMMLTAASVAGGLFYAAVWDVGIVARTKVDQEQVRIANREAKNVNAAVSLASKTVENKEKELRETQRQEKIDQASLTKAKKAAEKAAEEAEKAIEKFIEASREVVKVEAAKKIAADLLESEKLAYDEIINNLASFRTERNTVKVRFEEAESDSLSSKEIAKIKAYEAKQAREKAERETDQTLVENLKKEANEKTNIKNRTDEIAKKAKEKLRIEREAYVLIREKVQSSENKAADAEKKLAEKVAADEAAKERFDRAVQTQEAAKNKANSALALASTIDKRITALETKLSQAAEKSAKAISKAETELNDAKTALENAKRRSEEAKEFVGIVSLGETDIPTTAVRSALLAAGVGIVILLIQNFANSMRFYALLGEFYDSQADAFLAANSNSDLSVTYLKEFPPKGIDFGKTPTSLYEKALDLVGKFGKSNPKAAHPD
ncbi:MAG: hypothetical protein IH994_01030 [Proteobacteria bacterium]|nr:hypothetical protein [Pseudomonadota bacterium]